MAKPAEVTDRCPKCDGQLLDVGTYFYCPSEVHPGGFVVYPDGRQRALLIGSDPRTVSASATLPPSPNRRGRKK